MSKVFIKFTSIFLSLLIMMSLLPVGDFTSYANFNHTNHQDHIVDFYIKGTTVPDANAIANPAWYGAADGQQPGYPAIAQNRLPTDKVRWWLNVNTTYLFLPSGVDEGELYIYFNINPNANDSRVFIRPVDTDVSQNVQLTNSVKTDYFKDAFDNNRVERRYWVTCGNNPERITLAVRKPGKVGSVFITNRSGSLDFIHSSNRINYPIRNEETGHIMILDNDGNSQYNGEMRRLRGRGNATWRYDNTEDKNAYNLRIRGRHNLFGMGAHDRWALMANPYDGTNVQNKLSADLAREMGIDYTPQYKWVDVYINNHYRGLYQIATATRVDENRVNIRDLGAATETVNPGVDLESLPRGGGPIPWTHWNEMMGTYKYYNIPNDPADITGGYLLEIQLEHRYNRDDSESGFISNKGHTVVIDTPSETSKKQTEYIRDLFQKMEDAIYSHDGINPQTGKHYTEYLNERSAAKMYVLQEYAKNLDVGITSFYLAKDSDSRGDGKLHFVWPWDFDNAYGDAGGERDGMDLPSPNGFWAAGLTNNYNSGIRASWGRIFGFPGGHPNNPSGKHLVAELNQHEDFRTKAQYEYYSVLKPIVDNHSFDWIDEWADEIRPSAVNNDYRFFGAPHRDERFRDNINRLKRWKNQRKEFIETYWVSQEFPYEKYDVIFNSNGGSSVSPIFDAHSYEKITKPADPTRQGHTFAGWYKNTQLTIAWNFDRDVVTELTTLYARWTPIRYTVTFNSNGGSTVNSQTNVAHGTTAAKPSDPERQNYIFKGWYKNEALTAEWNFATDTVTSNLTLYAKWEEIIIKTYNVTFNAGYAGYDPGYLTPINPVTEGNKIPQPPNNPERVGFDFNGWYKDNLFTQKWDFDIDVVTENIILYAKWEVKKYTVTFNTNGGSSINPIEVSYNEKIIKPTDSQKDEHEFIGWYKDAQGLILWDFDNDVVTENTTLFAVWEKDGVVVKTYNVAFNAGYAEYEPGYLTPLNPVTEGNKIPQPPNTPERVGFDFDGWCKDNLFTQKWDFDIDTVTDNIILYAKWEAKKYTVTFNTNGGSSINPIVVSYNEKIIKPADPTRTGFTFVGWTTTLNGNILWNFDNDTVTQNIVLYAKWNENKPPPLPPSIVVTIIDGTKRRTITVGTSGKISAPKAAGNKNHTFLGWFTTANRKFNFNNKITQNTTLRARYYKNPSAPAKFKAARVRNKKGQIKLSWSRVRNFTYVLEMSTRRTSGFRKIRQTTTGSFTQKRLRAKRTYYFRIRRFIRVEGKTITSKYSSVKRVKI